jgi:hypothetical protein
MSICKHSSWLACAVLLISSPAVFAVETVVPAQKPDAEVSVPDASEVRAKKTVRAKGEITFDDIKLDLQKDEAYDDAKMTDGVKKLNGQKVKLRGYILPNSVFQQKGIKQFVLVRDNKECCFGPGAAIFDCVIVDMEEGKTTDFTTRIVTVAGKFAIDTENYRYENGKHFAIYKITATEVQ